MLTQSSAEKDFAKEKRVTDKDKVCSSVSCKNGQKVSNISEKLPHSHKTKPSFKLEQPSCPNKSLNASSKSSKGKSQISKRIPLDGVREISAVKPSFSEVLKSCAKNLGLLDKSAFPPLSNSKRM